MSLVILFVQCMVVYSSVGREKRPHVYNVSLHARGDRDTQLF